MFKEDGPNGGWYTCNTLGHSNRTQQGEWNEKMEVYVYMVSNQKQWKSSTKINPFNFKWQYSWQLVHTLFSVFCFCKFCQLYYGELQAMVTQACLEEKHEEWWNSSKIFAEKLIWRLVKEKSRFANQGFIWSP